MAKLRFSRRADEDLDRLVLNLVKDDPEAAIRLHDFVWKRLGQLRAHPRSGRKGFAAGTYELVLNKHYVAVYEYDDEDDVLVLAVHYAGEDWLKP